MVKYVTKFKLPNSDYGSEIVSMTRSNSPTAMSPRMNSSENITATGLGCFVANRNKWGDKDFFCHRIILI